jgi:hypothetical protein
MGFEWITHTDPSKTKFNTKLAYICIADKNLQYEITWRPLRSNGYTKNLASMRLSSCHRNIYDRGNYAAADSSMDKVLFLKWPRKPMRIIQYNLWKTYK